MGLSQYYLGLLANELEQKKADREYEFQQQREARANIQTLASLNEGTNALPPDFIGPHPQGSFQIPEDQARLIGLTPGMTYEPLNKSEIFPTRDINSGAIKTDTIPVPRGATVSTAGFKLGNPPGAAKTLQAKGQVAEDQATLDSIFSEIDRVQKLNEDAYGGVGGAAIMKVKSALNLGTNDIKFKNTADIVNTLQGQVARVLKSTFGGQLSDDERKYLNNVYGALPQLSNVERDIAMTNVKTMLQGKLAGSSAKYSAMSNKPVLGAGLGGQARPTLGTGNQPGTVRFTASDGSMHDIPAINLPLAKQRDPGLQVMQ